MYIQEVDALTIGSTGNITVSARFNSTTTSVTDLSLADLRTEVDGSIKVSAVGNLIVNDGAIMPFMPLSLARRMVWAFGLTVRAMFI